MTKKEELEERLLARKIGLSLVKVDERTLDEKLEDLNTMAEDFKDAEAARTVDQLIEEAKKTGDAGMFEEQKEEKDFSWEEIGEID